MYLDPRPSNPYYDYDAVRDPSMFFGRQSELCTLYNAIDKRQCFSIVGGRHIGKSSLLKFLGVADMQQCYGYDLQDRIFILTDWREYFQKTREDFFRSVCEQIVDQSKNVLTLQISSLSGEEKFKKVLEDFKNAGYRPVLLMDAFDRVTRNAHFDPDFFSFLRSLAGIYDLISYVTASLKPLYEVCHSDAVASSPFFNIFQTCTLGPLEVEEALELISVPAHRVGYEFSEEEVEWVLEQAGRHPFFIQVACRFLFDEKLRLDGEEVDLQRIQERIYQELLPHFDDAWKSLNDDDKREIKLEIARNGGSRRKMLELSEAKLFRKRIQEISSANVAEITVKDVKDALDNIDDNNFLENCSLGELEYVTLRLGGSSTTTTKKGALVRDLLKTACERMRPGNIRSDAASEWRWYNILWYHYFKYHLPNPNTAARLGIGSMRQFYREQDRAIQLLLKEIFDLEAEALRGQTV